jgi:16S rRNA (cytidine1402-2'-O)-methyltransferase
LPPKYAARCTEFTALKTVPATLVFYETGPRLADMLKDALETLGNRDAVVARELTKFFEEARRGTLAELCAHYAEHGPPKGEIVVLIAPPDASAAASEADVADALRKALLHMPVKSAAETVSRAYGWPKREVYALALSIKTEAEPS